MVNVVRVREMASQGLSGPTIAKAFGVSGATVRRIMRSSRASSAAMVGDGVCGLLLESARRAGRWGLAASVGCQCVARPAALKTRAE